MRTGVRFWNKNVEGTLKQTNRETSWGRAVPSSGQALTCMVLALFLFGLKKILLQKRFQVNKMFGLKQFLVQENFLSRKVFAPKHLGLKKN